MIRALFLFFWIVLGLRPCFFLSDGVDVDAERSMYRSFLRLWIRVPWIGSLRSSLSGLPWVFCLARQTTGQGIPFLRFHE